MRIISVVIASLLSVSVNASGAVKSDLPVFAEGESEKEVWVDVDENGNEIPNKPTGKRGKNGKKGLTGKSRQQESEQVATSVGKPNPVSGGNEKSLFAAKQAMAATVGLLAAAATAYAYRDEIQEASQPVLKQAGESVRWVNEEVIPKGVELFQNNIGKPVYENGEWVMKTLSNTVESAKENFWDPLYEGAAKEYRNWYPGKYANNIRNQQRGD
jgi:hypothetical protein